MTPMTARFRRQRWNPLRVAIHSLRAGRSLRRAESDWASAHASVRDLNEAYAGEKSWLMTCRRGVVMVMRIR